MTTIILDPGHGGSDPGSIGIDIHESAATLIATNLLNQYLTGKYAVTTYMTRTDNQTFPSLHDRAQMAIDKNAQAIVSMHYNHFDGTAHGYGDYIQELLPSYPKATASIALQNTVHAAVLPILNKYGLTDRGSLGQDLQVLRDSYAQCPGILIEGLFLDNAADSEFFYRADFMDDYIAALGDGIAQALSLPLLTPSNSDFQIFHLGQLVAQVDTITDCTNYFNNFYDDGGLGELEIKMINPLPARTTAFQKTYDFVGKAKADGDSKRSIWYTGSYTTDVAPSQVASEVNSGYAGVATQGDGLYLSYGIQNTPVGREVQMEFDFNLFDVGDINFIASNVNKLTFHLVPKAGCKYYAKVWDPVNNIYKPIWTDAQGNLGATDIYINKPDITQYISSTGVFRISLFSYNKTLADNTLVQIDFDYAKLIVDYVQ